MNGSTNGGHRVGGLFADAAGDFSGTTALGGANGDGTVFDIPSIDGSDAGTPTTFIGTDGAYPDAGLTAGATGDLSGTAEVGGADGDGTVFELPGTRFLVTITTPLVLSGGGNTVNYAPQGAAVTVDSGLGVSDTESATLAAATVAISAGFLAGDTLNQGGGASNRCAAGKMAARLSRQG